MEEALERIARISNRGRTRIDPLHSCAIFLIFNLMLGIGWGQLVVTNTDNSGPGSLRQQIADIPAGGTISFDASLAGASIELIYLPLLVDRPMTIDASGLVASSSFGDSTGIEITSVPDQFSRATRLVEISAEATDVTLISLGIKDGLEKMDPEGAVIGCGILNYGTVTLDDCVIRGNVVTYDFRGRETGVGNHGGGAANLGTMTMNRCVVADNSAGPSGQNTDGGDGGGVWNSGILSMIDCEISENEGGVAINFPRKGGRGAGIHNQDGTVVLRRCLIRGNQGKNGGHGGGISNTSQGNLEISASELIENRAGKGQQGFPDLAPNPGYPGGDGAGIYNHGTAVVTASLISENITGDGGRGRGVGASGGSGGRGAGIYNSGTLTLEASTLAGNRAGDGGAGTRAGFGGSGGGLYTNNSVSTTLRNVTVSGNRSGKSGEGQEARPGRGGGIYSASSDLVLEHVTVAGNHSDGDGGGIIAGQVLTIANSVISGNSAASGEAPDLAAEINSLGINLIGTSIGFTGTKPGDLVGVDAMLGPLGDFGGETATMLPLPGSPLVDSGANLEFETDQRGTMRSSADIGAVEFQDSDIDLLWVLDPDADGLAYGVEMAIGTDPFVPDRDSIANLSLSPQGVRFGRSIDAPAGTIWLVTRSSDLLTFEEIFRFDGENEVSVAGFSSIVEPTQITVNDSNPTDGAVYYRLEALITR